MQVNYLVIAIVAVLAIGLIAFLIWRDRKDEKDFMDELNGTPQQEEVSDDERYGL